MRLRIDFLILAAGSAWMTEHPDPHRAGQSEATATQWCAAKGCGLRLFRSDKDHLNEYVCNNRHVWRWDDAQLGVRISATGNLMPS